MNYCIFYFKFIFMTAKEGLKEREKHDQTTREKLIVTATKLFAQKGFDATTVKDIADESAMNISLVSYHFGGKEGLYSACLEGFARDKLVLAKQILKVIPKNIEEVRVRLEMYARAILDSHVEQSEIMKIMHRDIEMGNPVVMKIFEETFLKSVQLTIDFLKSAQKLEIVRKDIPALQLTSFFYGSVLHLSQKCDLGDQFFGVSIKNETQKKEIIENLMNFFMAGLTPLKDRIKK